jgi:hypothetical protein
MVLVAHLSLVGLVADVVLARLLLQHLSMQLLEVSTL